MMNAGASYPHPMGVVDQLDTAFRLYRRHFVTFIGIAALLHVPLLALTILFGLAGAEPAPTSLLGGAPGQNCLTSLVQLPINALITGALAYAVSGAYLGAPVGIREAYRYALRGRRFASLIFASLAVGILVGLTLIPFAIGFVAAGQAGWLCVLPWLIAYLYVTLRLAVTSQVIVLEDRGPADGIRRTWTLMQGHLLRALGLGILLGLATELLPLGLTLLGQWGLGMLSVSYPVEVLVTSGLSELITVALLPLPLGAYTLFYYDLRVRKEGFDLQVQAQRLMPTEPPAA